MSDIAKRLISDNLKSQNTYLDLGNCDLNFLPKELFRCTWLKRLNLGSSFIDEKWEQSKNKGLPNTFASKTLVDLKKLPNLTRLEGFPFSVLFKSRIFQAIGWSVAKA